MKPSESILEDYLNGDLGPEDLARLETLLRADPSARARLEHARSLRMDLRAAAPEVPSERMWQGIRERILRGESTSPLPEPSLWQRFREIFMAPLPALRWGLGGAAALLLLVFATRTGHRPEKALPPVPEQTAASLPALEASRAAAVPPSRPLAANAHAPSPTLARHPAPAIPPRGLSEVERALADQQLDDVIGGLLRQQALVAAAPQTAPAAPSAQTVSYSGGTARPTMNPAMDANGFWNFQPAALALNARNWDEAAVALEGAALYAPGASERAFAASSLHLLSQAGQPLAGRMPPDNLDPDKGMTVLFAGNWQYFTDKKVALYSNGVSARMQGLRSDGPGLQLELNFDRASFAPGTRFTRLAGGSTVKVTRPDGEAVGNAFTAPRGADYLFNESELRLK